MTKKSSLPLCTPEHIELICHQVRQGYSDAVAAAAAGVSSYCLQLWLRRGYLVETGELEEEGENAHCYRLYLAYQAAKAGYEKQLTDLFHAHIRDLPTPLRVRYEQEILARVNPRHHHDKAAVYEAVRQLAQEEARVDATAKNRPLDITAHIESIVLQALRELNKAAIHQDTLQRETLPPGQTHQAPDIEIPLDED